MKKLETIMIDDADLAGSYNWDEAEEQIELLNSQNYKGFNDWRLPTKEELDEIYLNRNEIGGFSAISYWSSTEYIAGLVWIQYFSSGYQNFNLKEYSLRQVRCVRSL